MNSKTKVIFFFLFVLFVTSCNKEESSGNLPVKEINGREVAEIDPLELNETTPFRISQLADSLHVVSLETNEECLLTGGAFLLIGKRYIVAKDGERILQFSADGEFIRELAKVGKGPGEIPTPDIRYSMDEELDLFLVSLGYTNQIYLYELSTGRFTGSINRQDVVGSTIRSFVVTPDSLIIYYYFTSALAPSDSVFCGVVVQDWDANLLWQKKFNSKTWTVYPEPINSEFISGSTISVLKTSSPENYIFQVDNQDTSYIFNSNDFTLEPYMLLKTQGTMKNGFSIGAYAVGSFMPGQQFNRVNGYQLIGTSVLSGLDDFPNSVEGYSYCILYDDNIKSAYDIGPFEDDFLDFVHIRSGPYKVLPHSPSLAPPNGKLLVKYNAYQFIELAEDKLDQPDTPDEIKQRLSGLLDGLTENSNPILVIGDVKENIVID